MLPDEHMVCISVPKDFVWLARQYSGEWFIFTHKPVITASGDYFDDDLTRPIEHWLAPIGHEVCLNSEIELVLVPDWKSSLRYIGH